MNHSEINLETWNRRDLFNHYIQNVRCVTTVTAKIDVAGLLNFCKTNHYRFYPAFLYLVAKAVNLRDEFKIRYDASGKLIRWQTVSPSYIVFHPEDECFTRLITGYDPDFHTFYDRALSDMAKHEDKRGLEIPYDAKNIFDASCIPWLHYEALDLHVFDSGTYLAPVVTWGKYEQNGDKVIMPLTMQIHHAVADGFHIARFYADVEAEMKKLLLKGRVR